MTISELSQKISDSVLSDESKKKILDVIAGYPEVTPELEDKVTGLIQEDIDQGFADAGIDENLPEVKAAHEEMNRDLEQTGADLDAELALVDKEVAELDAMKKELNGYEDQQKIADLKAGLAQ